MLVKKPIIRTSIKIPDLWKSETSSEKFSFPSASTGAQFPEETSVAHTFKEKTDFKGQYSSNVLKPDEKTIFPRIIENLTNDVIYWIETEEQPITLSIAFSKEVENAIMQDMVLMKFINQIERSLNEFIKDENLKFENKIHFQDDWEIPNYKKLILNISLKGIPFKDKIQKWKKISSFTHDHINSFISNSSGEIMNKFKEIQKKFFIKLDF